MRIILQFIIIYLALAPHIFADFIRPDHHAPIGVMKDHTHNKSEFMIAYRFMLMTMDDMLINTDAIESSELFSSTTYMMSPDKMNMSMHMLGGMYGLTDSWTLALMAPYLSSSMVTDIKVTGGTIEPKSHGLGDLSISGLYSLYNREKIKSIFSFGLNLPTGSIDQKFNNNTLGYPMQLGSGSFAIEPSFVISRFWHNVSIGTQIGIKVYLNENSSNYKQGTESYLNFWTQYLLSKPMTVTLRLEHKIKNSYVGSNPVLNTMMSPMNRSDLQGGHISYAFLGSNILLGGSNFLSGLFSGQRLALEFGLPFYQNLKGPQMKSRYKGIVGWQMAF